MSTGVEAKAAQIAAKVATEAQQQNQTANPQMTGEGSPFAQMLQDHETSVNAMSPDMLQSFGISDKTHPADKAVSAQGLDINLSEAQQVEKIDTNVAKNLLSELNHQGLQMEKTVEMMTMPGSNFNNFELLSIQAQLHHATFRAELFMKIADATKTIPQTMINRYGGQ